MRKATFAFFPFLFFGGWHGQQLDFWQNNFRNDNQGQHRQYRSFDWQSFRDWDNNRNTDSNDNSTSDPPALNDPAPVTSVSTDSTGVTNDENSTQTDSTTTASTPADTSSTTGSSLSSGVSGLPLVPDIPNTGTENGSVTSSVIPPLVPTLPGVGDTPIPPVDTNMPPPQTSDGSSTDATPPAGGTEPQTPPPSSGGDIFQTGAVTFRFDDGWQSQYDVALPALQSAGIRGTFYIVTRQLQDDGFSGFMSKAEVQQLAGSQEVAAHTQTHPHLPTLSSSQQQTEIAGSKSDLESMGITGQSFSYPYGEYTADTTQIVKDAGFSSAVTTIETAVSPGADRFQLPSPSLQLSDTPQSIEAMIDSAIANHQWLIMTFHRIDSSGDQYSITPSNFQEVVNYVKDHNIPTVTVSEGAAAL